MEVEATTVPIGPEIPPETTTEVRKKCKRAGCKKYYYDSTNTQTSCKFHPGKPIFHDIKKGWDCCGKIAYDWEEFEKIEGCCVGMCSDVK
jgi:disease resistance protein